MVHKYTKYPEADAIIDLHMKEIAGFLREKLKDLVCVVLMGGLARGEGVVYRKDGKLVVLNDYDIYVITEKSMGKAKIEEYRDVLSKKLNQEYEKFETSMEHVFYVDIRNKTEKDLMGVLPLIKWYEVFNSGFIVWRREGFSFDKYKDKIKQEEIPFEEGARHLLNRMALILRFRRNKSDKKSIRDMLFFTAKAYSAIPEAFLLLEREFVCSYGQRSLEFAKMLDGKYKGFEGFLVGLKERILLMDKIRSRFADYEGKYSLEEVEKMWRLACRDLFYCTCWYLKKTRVFDLIKKGRFFDGYMSLFLEKKGFGRVPVWLLRCAYRSNFNYKFLGKIAETKEFSSLRVFSKLFNTEPTAYVYVEILKIFERICKKDKGNFVFMNKEFENFYEFQKVFEKFWRCYESFLFEVG